MSTQQMARMLMCTACMLAGPWGVRADSRPVIGMLTQPSDSSLLQYGSEYLVASYVKWIESSGARVAPVRWNQTDAELAQLFSQLSGFLIPGGHCGFHGTAYGNRTWHMLDMAREINQNGVHFPVWGTCQGFQQLAQYADGKMEPSVIHATDSEDLALPLHLTPMASQSRMLGAAPADVVNTLTGQGVTLNLHHYSVVAANLSHRHPHVTDFFEVIATSADRLGVEFLTLMEGKQLPFYGSQFHPEKNAFEWDQSWEKDVNGSVVQGRDAIQAVTFLADFFVGEARRCAHSWPRGSKFPLIYASVPRYVAYTSSDLWEQVYTW